MQFETNCCATEPMAWIWQEDVVDITRPCFVYCLRVRSSLTIDGCCQCPFLLERWLDSVLASSVHPLDGVYLAAGVAALSARDTAYLCWRLDRRLDVREITAAGARGKDCLSHRVLLLPCPLGPTVCLAP